MFSFIGPIIKAGLIGGAISGGIYGTYKLALDISTTTFSGSGVDVFANLSSASKHVTTLDSVSAALKILNNSGLSNIIETKSTELKQIMNNPDTKEIVTKTLSGCTDIKNKNKISCKNSDKTLDILINKLSKTTETKSNWWLPTKTPENMTEFLKTASSEELIDYLDGISIIEKTTDKLFGKTKSAWSSGVSDSISTVYTWFKSNAQKNKKPVAPK